MDSSTTSSSADDSEDAAPAHSNSHPPFPVSPQEDFLRQLQAARGGCRETLGLMLQSLRNYLLLVAVDGCRSSAYSRQSPSDFVQCAQMEAVRDFHQFQGNTETELQSWLQKILIRNLLDMRRSKIHLIATQDRKVSGWDSLIRTPDDLPADDPTPSSVAARNERDDLLHELLKQLPEHYRQTIELHHFQKMTFDQIGQKWGCSPHAVRGLWTRALQKLGKTVGPLL